MARFEQQPNGNWKAIVSTGKGADGKYGRQFKTFRTKKEAQTWVAEETRSPTTAGKTTLGEWLDQWLEIKKRETEPNTVVWYERRVRLHIKPTIGSAQLRNIKATDVERMLRAMAERVKPASQKEQCKALRTLRTALKEAFNRDLVSVNAALKVRMPKAIKAEKKVVCFDHAAATRFLEAAKEDRLFAMYWFALDAGCRPGEIFALRWTDLSWEACAVTVKRSLEEIKGQCREKGTKTGRQRTLKLSPGTIEALKAHQTRMTEEGHNVTDGLVFCAKEGGYLRNSDVRRQSFKKVLLHAKLPGTKLYVLRHTSATLQLLKGVNIKTVSERLGHSKIQVTLDYYASVLPIMQDHAATVMQSLFGSPTAPVAVAAAG